MKCPDCNMLLAGSDEEIQLHFLEHEQNKLEVNS